MANNKKKRAVSSQALEKAAEPTPHPAPTWPRAYFERTRAILDERARKQQKADQAAKKALVNLIKEAEADAVEVVESNFEKLSERVESLPVLRTFEKRSERFTALVDGWLDRLGLVRKSTLA